QPEHRKVLMSLRLPLVDLPGGTYQEPAVERKIVVVRKSSAAEMVGPPSKRPAELVVYTNPPKSISPPLVSPFNQKTRMSLSGFMLFVRKERNTISEKYPNASQEQLTAIYQKHWNALDKGMQATLNSQAHELNLRLGNVSPHSPPDVVKENEGDLSKIIQVAHATPQVPRPAISRETIDRLQTVASSLGLKRKMSATVERGVLTPATGSTTRAVRPPQQQTAAATANNGLSAAAALEFYYLSLCQPAFPEAGEPPLTPAPPQFYLDQWQMLEWQRREGGAQRL
ncbi:hypothetical protein PENTCL1PPCAC_10465, partial [Pristionchus entomophagus]